MMNFQQNNTYHVPDQVCVTKTGWRVDVWVLERTRVHLPIGAFPVSPSSIIDLDESLCYLAGDNPSILRAQPTPSCSQSTPRCISLRNSATSLPPSLKTLTMISKPVRSFYAFSLRVHTPLFSGNGIRVGNRSAIVTHYSLALF